MPLPFALLVGSSKANADVAAAAAWLFSPRRHACPGLEYVPVIAIAWGHMLAGCFSHVVDEFCGCYLLLQREQYKQYEEKGECACVHMYERIYVLIFSLEFPTSGLGFPQHPKGPLSQHPTKPVGIQAWHIYNRGP